MEKHSHHVSPFLFATLIAATVVFIIDLLMPLGWIVWLPYIALVLILLWVPGRKSPLLLTGLCTIFIILGLFVDSLDIQSGTSLDVGIFNRTLGIAVLWVIAALVLKYQRIEVERENLIRQLQDVLANAERLRGLLPFCLSCKKIRVVNGYWSRIEPFIAKHSLAEFMPGLCPECEEYLSAQLPEEQSLARGQR